jgi:hypothetical protein
MPEDLKSEDENWSEAEIAAIGTALIEGENSGFGKPIYRSIC